MDNLVRAELNAGALLGADRERHRTEYTAIRIDILNRTGTARSSVTGRHEHAAHGSAINRDVC